MDPRQAYKLKKSLQDFDIYSEEKSAVPTVDATTQKGSEVLLKNNKYRTRGGSVSVIKPSELAHVRNNSMMIEDQTALRKKNATTLIQEQD